MKKIRLFVLLTTIFSLSSCTITDYLERSFEKYQNNQKSQDITFTYVTHEDTGQSIDILNDAFNSTDESNLSLKLIDNELDYEPTTTNNYETITKNFSDLKYFEGLTPSTGIVNGLVIPVDFTDNIAKSITKNDNYKPMQSVKSYYKNASYGKLDMNFDVLDWVSLPHKASYYSSMTEKSQKIFTGEVPGVSAIISDALNIIENYVDLTKYDNDKDGHIDCLYIIYNHAIDYENAGFWWAFNYYALEAIRKYDDVLPYNYVFAGYDFLFENDYTCNTITYIHETGHMFGLEDYYDNDYDNGIKEGGLGGADMMDNNVGDHNPFSKLCLGWIDKVILVDLNDKQQIDLFITNYSYFGETIMICDNYDKASGVFQDYFLISYFNGIGYMGYNQVSKGFRVYRIHAGLETKTLEETNETYETLKYNNSDTKYKLIDAINRYKLSYSRDNIAGLYNYGQQANNSNLFGVGSGKSRLYYYDAKTTTSDYYFYVTSLGSDGANIRIIRR